MCSRAMARTSTTKKNSIVFCYFFIKRYLFHFQAPSINQEVKMGMVNNKNLQKLSWYRRSGYSYLVLYIWYEKPANEWWSVFWSFGSSKKVPCSSINIALKRFWWNFLSYYIVKRIKAYVLREGTGEYFFTNCRIFLFCGKMLYVYIRTTERSTLFSIFWT